MKKSIRLISLTIIFLLPTERSLGQSKNSKETVMHAYLCSDIGAKRVFLTTRRCGSTTLPER